MAKKKRVVSAHWTTTIPKQEGTYWVRFYDRFGSENKSIGRLFRFKDGSVSVSAASGGAWFNGQDDGVLYTPNIEGKVAPDRTFLFGPEIEIPED